ncbi:MAG TPA: hypothetical protein VGB97_01285 [Candidatus Paceibacterota bacterium]|jgi:hypothetical protein
MNKLSLLVVTDLTNGAEAEDILISDFLRRNFTVVLCHPADCEPFEDSVDRILIRNYWNSARYGESEPWYDRWRTKPQLPIHDDLYMKQGYGKDYLLELYASGFPVIPSIDSIESLDALPSSEAYFIKPKDGYSAINAREVSRMELLELKPQHYLIQSFVDFEYEISFYYLDKKLQYTLYAPDKAERWGLAELEPSADDIAFAERFVQWNKQTYGIERIDACRLRDGSLQLVEITDQGGAYLSVPLLSEKTRHTFLSNLSSSLSSGVK